MNLIGVDIGTSIMKIIEADSNGNIINKEITEEKNVIDVLKKFINKNKIDKKSIEAIILTGVGASKINEIEGFLTYKIDEFVSIGEGGIYLSKKKDAIIISVGTGTAFVKVLNGEITHEGGSGLGGGTFQNLCALLTGKNDIKEIEKNIKKGNIENIDLKIKDITNEEILTLPKDTTSSNFGKLNNPTKEDLSLGVLNLIFESIGVMSALIAKNAKIKDIVLIGTISTIQQIKNILNRIEKLYNVKFIIPENSEFGTIIGAIEYYKKTY